MVLTLDVPTPSNPFIGAVVMAALSPSLQRAAQTTTPGPKGTRYTFDCAGRTVELPLGRFGSITAAGDSGRLRVSIPRALWTLGHAAGMETDLVEHRRCRNTGDELVWLPKGSTFAIPVEGVGPLALTT